MYRMSTPRYSHRGKPIADRFWPKVVQDPDGCWGWTAHLDHNGYPQIGRGGRGNGMTRASRVSWELHNGPIPEGLSVRHRCDNRICTRPDHLELGTQADNMRDAKDRGRIRNNPPRGIAHWKAKLTDEDVADIRRLRSEGIGSTALAAQFGVSRTHIKRVVRGDSRA
jgi:hypothetical protein